MKVLNLNLWNKNYYWDKRKSIIVDLLKSHGLNGKGNDLLVFQEVVKDREVDHLKELNQQLDYQHKQFFPARKDAGMGLLTNLKIIRQKLYKFTKNADDHRDTFPRLIALLEMEDNGKRFVLGTTHFAVMPISHIRNCKESLQAIEDFNHGHLPAIVGGDFNCAPHEPTAEFYRQAGFIDVWSGLGLPEFASWPVVKQLVIDNKILSKGKPPDFEIEARRVDYIWVKNFKPKSAVKIGAKVKGIWHSDHWGILAEVANV